MRMTPAVAVPHYQEISDALHRYGVSFAGLFGSRALGDNRPDSDYDILVEFAPDSPTTFLGMMKLKGQLEDILGRPVDLVTKQGLSPYLRTYILATVKPFYGQES